MPDNPAEYSASGKKAQIRLNPIIIMVMQFGFLYSVKIDFVITYAFSKFTLLILLTNIFVS